ncbi:MAG: AAA family ATPase [Acidobacteriota bacterium]
MLAIIERCRDYLERAYRDKLGVGFSDSLCQLATGRQPVWRFVSAQDLTSRAAPGETGVGVLLDPEIGLLFYLALFDSHANMRQQIIGAAALGSQLSLRAGPSTPAETGGDRRGAWRVVFHWLVDAADRRNWIEQIADVRRETCFSEDVSVDAIFFNAGESLEEQLSRHGFPRLLLETRAVLRKQHLEDVAQWMSADDLVSTALSDFPFRFEKREQRELAEGIVQAVRVFAHSCAEAPEIARFQEALARPRTLDCIRIESFRNLGNIVFDFGREPVNANIIHGSNGTGKTSLCEAISLALFGSSSNYRGFCDRSREKDVSVTDRTREYLGRYLTPLQPAGQSSADAWPKIALNEEPLLPLQLAAAAETAAADTAMDGTILHQDTSLELVKMPAAELGARILRGYSELADYVEEYVESRVLQANSGRQDFLRTFGLPASITKVDTAFERMARREIDRSLPGFPRPLAEWLDTTRVEAQLARRWREWGNESSRIALARRLSVLDTSPSNLAIEIRTWLEEFNELVALSHEILKKVDAIIGPLRPELDQVAGRIALWGQWLDSNRAGSPASCGERVGSELQAGSSAQALLLSEKLGKLQAEQQRIIEQGRNAARHFDHLIQVDAYVREVWGRQHAEQCPTCGASHAGGILPVIQSWREQTAAERDRLRNEYTRLKVEIDSLQKSLADAGPGCCPIAAGEQSRIVEALQWLIPGNADFQEWIRIKSQREELSAVITALKQIPVVPGSVDAENEAARVAQELVAQFADARQRFDAPSNWKPVKEELTAMLADIVNQHLPQTLGALWSELCLNLTPAPWLLPERPSIDVTTKRGEQRSSVQVQGRLARYILNQSEIHVLGLAWFFTRYLTRGRFAQACLIMDDPAYALDQAGFRDLCRLWQTLIRLHRVYERPLRLIVTLNQEDRASEAARATGGALSFLSWTPDQSQPLHTTRLVAEDVLPPQPIRLFERMAS